MYMGYVIQCFGSDIITCLFNKGVGLYVMLKQICWFYFVIINVMITCNVYSQIRDPIRIGLQNSQVRIGLYSSQVRIGLQSSQVRDPVRISFQNSQVRIGLQSSQVRDPGLDRFLGQCCCCCQFYYPLAQLDQECVSNYCYQFYLLSIGIVKLVIWSVLLLLVQLSILFRSLLFSQDSHVSNLVKIIVRCLFKCIQPMGWVSAGVP